MTQSTQTQSRKLVYYIAITLDNFIAHEDETFDGFIMEGHSVTDYLNSLRDYDTVLMGRKTYEQGYKWGVKPGEPSPTYAHMMQYVFSQRMEHYQHEQLEVIRENPATFIKRLKQQDGGAIYLCGGGELAGYLLEHELIDELRLKLNPVAFGKGIPLFGSSKKGFALSLLDTKVYNNGLVLLNYTVCY